MIISMQCVNEEHYVKRVMSNIHDLPFVERIVVVDGGSTDYTVQELLQYDKVEVFVHPWLDWYHDMNSMQRNIGLSYIPHGEVFFMMDFDERLSDPLIEYLARVDKEGIHVDLVHVSRRTVEVMRYPNPITDEPSHFAIIGEDGWPIESHQIGQYPDWQPRLIKKHSKMFWSNSPHHVLRGVRDGFVGEQFDIIHYEKNDSRHRFLIERKWAREQATRKKLGLLPDVMETRLKPEVAHYGDPKNWK